MGECLGECCAMLCISCCAYCLAPFGVSCDCCDVDEKCIMGGASKCLTYYNQVHCEACMNNRVRREQKEEKKLLKKQLKQQKKQRNGQPVTRQPLRTSDSEKYVPEY